MLKWYFVQVDCKANDWNKTGLAQAQPMATLGPDLGRGNQAHEKWAISKQFLQLFFCWKIGVGPSRPSTKKTMPTLPGPLMGMNFRPKSYQAFFSLAWPAKCRCHEKFPYGSWLEQQSNLANYFMYDIEQHSEQIYVPDMLVKSTKMVKVQVGFN